VAATVAVLSALFVAGCSAAATPQGASDQSGRLAVRASLGQCASNQSAIAQALHQNNAQATLQALEQGRITCAAAAADIRKSPIGGIDSAAADALDQMSDGLRQVVAGLHATGQNRAQGEAMVDAGMRLYMDAAARLKRANG
jgi:hypothetical protein